MPDKRTEELFDKVFKKLDTVSTHVAKNGAIQTQHSDDIKYIRQRMDSLASIVSTTAARLDTHIKDHKNETDKISAWAAVISAVVAIGCLIIAIV